jgi:hypothetical protein
VRERGTQSRRVRPGPVEPMRRPGPPPQRSGGSGNFWQVLAIIALVAATAGWTTVAVMALRPGPSAEAEVPVESFDPEATDDTDVPPVADTHDAPELESLLPATLSGANLVAQSWDGDELGYLNDDPWSTSMAASLSAVCKTPADLQVAQAYDQDQTTDVLIYVYRIDGVEAAAMRDALLAAWKSDYPSMTVSQVALGGKDVTKGDFGEDNVGTYVYVSGDFVYDIETADESVATAVLAGLPAPPVASSAPPASTAPAASCVPPSGSPAPEPSPSAS